MSADPEEETIRQFLSHEATGRPVGSGRFLKRLEMILTQRLHPQKPGRKKKNGAK